MRVLRLKPHVNNLKSLKNSVTHELACLFDYIYFYALLYEMRSRVVCYPKIKLNPRVLGFC